MVTLMLALVLWAAPQDVVLEYGACVFLALLVPLAVGSALTAWKDQDKTLVYGCTVAAAWILFGIYEVWPR